MNGHEISDYKRKIMKKLIDDETIFELINYDGSAEYPDDMLYKNIFPYNRIPETEQEESVYVCVMIDIPTIYARNNIARNVNIRLRVYSHERLMQVKGQSGDRIDLVSARIDELLNEKFDFGIGFVSLGSNTEHVLDSRHFYREMIFKTESLNSKRDGVHQWEH